MQKREEYVKTSGGLAFGEGQYPHSTQGKANYGDRLRQRCGEESGNSWKRRKLRMSSVEAEGAQTAYVS